MNIQEQKDLWNNPNNWVNDGHEWSEYFGTTDNLWNIIYPKIKPYLNGETLEIAPGFGRITEYLLKETSGLSIVDLNSICIDKCKEKFGNKIKSYIVNDGKSLDYNNDTFDFIISFDSFVHMTEDVIECYIKEIDRTLKNDGFAFIHHSFFFGSERPTENIGGRSNMTMDLFRKLVESNNMKIISQEEFRISSTVVDTLSIFKK